MLVHIGQSSPLSLTARPPNDGIVIIGKQLILKLNFGNKQIVNKFNILSRNMLNLLQETIVI